MRLEQHVEELELAPLHCLLRLGEHFWHIEDENNVANAQVAHAIHRFLDTLVLPALSTTGQSPSLLAGPREDTNEIPECMDTIR